MSMFKRLFGSSDKKSEPAAPVATAPSSGSNKNGTVNHSIEHLETTIELLEKREEVLLKKAEQELLKAKAFKDKGNVKAAVQCMQRKKMLEEQLNGIAAQKTNMETMKFAIQSAAMNKEVMMAQRQAASSLKQINKTMDAEQVEDVMDEIRETIDQSKSVAEALAQPLDDQVIDEDELMADLENELMGLEVQEQPVQQRKKADAALPAMPSLPTKALPAKAQPVDEDEEALAALEAELNS